MTEEPDSGETSYAHPVDAHSDALRFLEHLLTTNPDLQDAALSAELDTLLGRAHRAVPKVDRRWAAKVDEVPVDAPDFGWYQQLLALSPAMNDDYIGEAARRVEAGLLAEERLAKMETPLASRRELAELHTLVSEGRDAWSFMVLSNLRLVFHWSKGVARSVDSDWAQDAFQVGCIGLMRGLQGWDYRMGYKLSTFVSWHIRQAIQRWRANDVMIIRVPVHVWEALGYEDADLTDKVRESARRAQDLASLEAMLFDRNEDEAWDGGITALEEQIDRERIMKSLLDGLDERSLDIIERRFGLRNDLDGPMTLDQIGDVWGVTRERIRQLEKRILEALQRKARGEELRFARTKRVRRKKGGGESLNATADQVPVSDPLPS
ncbi:hypothetical protein GCM10027058_29390 [Microbacterium neimengense]